jgi:hypothetical protein
MLEPTKEKNMHDHVVYGAVLGWVYVSVARKTAERKTPVWQGDPHSWTSRSQQ